MEKQIKYIDIESSGVSYCPIISIVNVDGKKRQAILESEVILHGNKYFLPQQILEETDLWADYLSNSYQKAEFSCRPGAFKAVIYKDGIINIYRFIDKKSIFKRILDEIAQLRASI